MILDEVQSLPEMYMPLVGALLRQLAELYGTRFILMTATQPKLLELGDRLLGKKGPPPVELLPGHERYFRELKRTKLVPVLTKKHTSEVFGQRDFGEAEVLPFGTCCRQYDSTKY